MAELVLQASDDLVARLAHEREPVRAVVELVWNAIDGEAHAVDTQLERGAMGGITTVSVRDDGHGISSDEVETTFGRIGDSWKKRSARTKNSLRAMHGQLGEGRLRAFALGSRVEWASHSVDTAGEHKNVTITGSRGSRNVFQWDATGTQPAATGTTVTAYNDEQRSLAALEPDSAVPTLSSHFAPVLLNDASLTITYDGAPLEPAQEIRYDTRLDISFGEGAVHQAQLRIIEWKAGRHRALYFGADEEHFVCEEPGNEIESQYPYSAYITWDGLGSARLAEVGLGELAPEPVSDLWRAVRDAVREHFARRRHENRREQLQRWKDTGVYPYEGEPASEPEQAERAVFDAVSGALSPHIPGRGPSAQLTLALLRDAIRHDPYKLTTILREVVALSESDRDALTSLLTETTLSAIIKAADLIASRHKFIRGLEHLLFDPDDAPTVGERAHLHRILERELWIFGESYHLMSSERGLTDLLRTHLKLEGLPETDARPVTQWDGRTGRTDLHLAARCMEQNRIRHLIVELKAPNVIVGQKDLIQLENYGHAIRLNPLFASSRAQWDLILVATSLDEIAEGRILADDPDDSDLGRFWAPRPKPGHPRVTAYARQWRDVIDENKRRLEFVTSALQHDPSISEGLDYVRRKYAEMLPESITVS